MLKLKFWLIIFDFVLAGELSIKSVAPNYDEDELDSMAEAWSQSFWTSRVEGTWKKYSSYWVDYVAWKATTKDPNPLNANSTDVVIYLLYMLGSDMATESTINATLASISLIFEAFNLVNPCANAIVKAQVESIMRIVTKPVQKKKPLSLSMVKNGIMRNYKANPKAKQVKLLLLYVLECFAIKRWGDIQYLRASHFERQFDGSFLVKIPKSKTDQRGRGGTFKIAQASDGLNIPDVLSFCLKNIAKDFEKSDFIFCKVRIARGGGYRVHEDSRKSGKDLKVISYSSMRCYFREDLLVEGVDPDKYGLHSGRRTGATLAERLGVKKKVIKKTGAWKSDKSVEGYIDEEEVPGEIVSRVLAEAVSNV